MSKVTKLLISPEQIPKSSFLDYSYTRSLGAPTSSWRPFGPLDFVLRALRSVIG